MSDKQLAGTVAIVTGAVGGVGTKTAHRLARDGAVVALVASDGARAERIARDIGDRGGVAVAVRADLTDPGEARRAVQGAHDRLGRLDILVNTAGLMLLDTALHATVDDWDRMVALNVTGLLHVTHAAVPFLIDAAATSPRGVADIVNVGTTAGRAARPGSAVHTLTGFGLVGFTESLRQELLVERVRVGLVEAGSDLVRAPRPDDVADAVGYVVTRDRGTAVNGVVLRAEGTIW
jgi:NADP-dependent 3-hydroxy acid dehydrogenase YdfG